MKIKKVVCLQLVARNGAERSVLLLLLLLLLLPFKGSKVLVIDKHVHKLMVLFLKFYQFQRLSMFFLLTKSPNKKKLTSFLKIKKYSVPL